MIPDDNAEDLFPRDFVPSRPTPTQHRPEPWHKPRKHWIRKCQWCELISGLIAELSFDGRPFRYLTLPGRYLLDVRQLHEICQDRNILLKFLGFDTGLKSEPETNISADEVWRLSHIHRESQLLADPVESVSNPSSVASLRISQFGDFDAINLDLCDSIASREAGASDSALEAILSLITLQSEVRSVPWLLFLTTRADRPTVKASVMERLLTKLKENIDHSTRFRATCNKHQIFSDEAIQAELNGEQVLNEKDFVQAFSVGISKWLLNISITAWKVHQQVSAYYRVNSACVEPDMLSLAFRFERQQPLIEDRVGIVHRRRTAKNRESSTEEDLALRMLKQSRKIIDVDELLHVDERLREEIISENAMLMGFARFDYERMMEWGRKNCWRPS